MSNVNRFSVSVLAGLWLCAGGAQAADVEVPMSVQQIGSHVFFVQGVAGIATDNAGFISNAGFVVTEEGIVVFDALGTPALGRRLLAEIRKRSPAPITKIFLSHYHADHFYGLPAFAGSGAQIFAARGSEDYLQSDAAQERLAERRVSLAPWVDTDTRLIGPDRLIDKDMNFELGGVRFRISYLGNAHSDGDLAMFVEPDGVLFSGDVIFEGRIPYLGSANTRNWLATLKRLEGMKLQAVIPGHGPAAANPGALLAGTRRYLEFVRRAMGRAVRDFEPFDEAYERTDWSEFWKLPAFAEANRRNAYQVFLSMEQEWLAE